MRIIQRTIPRVIKVAGVTGFAGLGMYYAKQYSTAFAESNEPKTVFSGLGFTTLRLQSIITVNHNTKRLVFEYPDETASSGLTLTSALLAITHPEGSWLPTIRPYTPISDLEEPGCLELMVKKYPDGKASGYLHSLRPGDSLRFAAALKGYQWKPNELSHAYLVAGGAGITPIYQLIKNVLKNPHDKTKLTLIFGVNSEEDLLLKEELDRYATDYPDRFNYIYTVSRPKENSHYRTGYIDEELLKSEFKGSMQNTKTTVPVTAKMSGQNKSLYPEPNVLTSSLKVGADLLVWYTGGYQELSGLLTRSFILSLAASTGLRVEPPFGLAATGLRSNILKLHYEDKATPKQRAYVSALSGGVAGGAVTRLMGYVGQRSYNAIDTWQMENANTTSKPFLQRMADSKWIPLKSLSDDEYRGILNEKLLSIEAEIALIDDKIGELEKLKTSGFESGHSDPAAK
ncbi:hypothetical protein AbraIFM66950_005294 [Aspergillus brasiliensis]|nr:hypothetical protein AbraIFM66950_005294 [Aspergillus brasiliensis]